MTLIEIRAAIAAGKTVHWSNAGYIVSGSVGNELITFTGNNHSIGLTWLDGVTVNGKPHEFFVAGDRDE